MNLFGWMRVNWKAALACSALGSFFTILGMLVSPLEADRDKFVDIECKTLTVTDGIATYGIACEVLDVNSSIGRTFITGSSIIVKNDKHSVHVNPPHPGLISAVEIIDDANSKTLLQIGVDEHGGYVVTKGRSKGYAGMGIDEHGNGAISTYDKNGYLQ